MTETSMPPPPQEITSPEGKTYKWDELDTEKRSGDASVEADIENKLSKGEPEEEIVDNLADMPEEPEYFNEQNRDEVELVDPDTGKSTSEGKLTKEPPPEEEKKSQTEKEKQEKYLKRNLDKQLAKAQADTDKAFGERHPDYEKNEDGTPKDPAQMAEYIGMYEKNSEQAHAEAMRAAVVEEYTDEHPRPDRAKDPEGFDKWARDLKDQLDALEEAKKAGKVEGTRSGEKVTIVFTGAERNAPPKEAPPKTAPKEGEEEEGGEKKEEGDASWGNAAHLALESLATSKKEDAEAVKKKIQEISDKNPDIKPTFDKRVKAMKVLIVGLGMGLMVGVGAAKEVTKDAKPQGR